MMTERRTGRRWIGLMLALCLLAVLASVGAASSQPTERAAPAAPQLDQRLAAAMNLLDFELQQLDVRSRGRAPVRVPFTFRDAPAQIELRPSSVRSSDFAIYTQDANGRLTRQTAPPATTFRGSLTGRPDSRVAASIRGGKLKAFILDNQELWVLEPVHEDVLPGDHDLYALYRSDDLAPGPWTCGATHEPLEPLDRHETARGGAATSCVVVAELAVEADAEYFQLNNSSIADTTADMEDIINAVNLLYGFQVGIEHLIGDVVIHEQVALDPYSSTSSAALLDEFTTYRVNNPYPNPADVAHLFTGKELNGSVIGIAWLFAVCDDDFKFGLSQSQFTTNFMHRVILTAHELGHNWSARHCDFDPDCGVMCSAVASCLGPGDVFGQRSRTDIVDFRNSISCIGDGAEAFAANGKLLASDPGPNDFFGVSVDISGTIAIVGAYREDEGGIDAGAAYIYEFDGEQWLEAAKLLPGPDDLAPGDRFGVSVAISDDGEQTTAVVGAYLDTGLQNTSGSAYIFRRIKDKWTQIQKIVKPAKQAGDLFGLSVDISGDFIIVGAPQDDTKATAAGAAFIYKDNGINFEYKRTLTAGPGFGSTQDQFGTSVAIDSDPHFGTTAVVGAWMDDETGPNSGSAYIFKHIPATKKEPERWEFVQKLCPAATGDQFGYSVAIRADRIAVGAWLDDQVEEDAGAVWVFQRELGGMWTVNEKVVDVLAEDDNFGSAVDLEDGAMVVGAYLDDVIFTDAGVVHTYREGPTGWMPVGRLEPDDLEADDQLGLSVAISGDLGIAGSWRHDDDEMNQGAAYVFLIAPDPTDCDGSGIPDHCEIESGILPDCNDNNVPDVCDIADGTSTDDDMNGVPDECDFDCNNNGITDSTEIADGSVPDCNGNGVPDSCDIDPTDPDGDGMVSDDVNGDGIPDECSPDCNGNGIPDSVDISDGTSLDCNGNGVPDECDREDFEFVSAELSPVGPADPHTVTLDSSTTAPPWALGDVTVVVVANADLDLTTEYVRLYLDGAPLFELFRSGAIECPVDNGFTPDVETVFIPADVWNTAIRRDNAVDLFLEPTGSINPLQCPSGSWMQLGVTYASGDCNDNGVLDECEIADGMATDCNGNAVPDECELALFDCNGNGVLDDCEFGPADIDGNGVVDVFDLIALLSAWGPCPGCPEDITDATGTGPDGVVDVFDLIELLQAWTACP